MLMKIIPEFYKGDYIVIIMIINKSNDQNYISNCSPLKSKKKYIGFYFSKVYEVNYTQVQVIITI